MPFCFKLGALVREMNRRQRDWTVRWAFRQDPYCSLCGILRRP